MIQNAKHWIFDLDGTLTQPVQDFSVLRRALSLGPEVDILSAVSEAEPDRAAEMRQLISDWEWDAAKRAIPAPHVHELLETLLMKGCEVGVLTRNLKAIAVTTLAQIDCLHFFEDGPILGREESAPKPNPEGVFRCLADFKAEGTSIFVGDFIYDLQAGRSAGCYTILRAKHCPESWRPFTDLWIQEFDELLAQLND